jgi:hypothetical protein
MVSSSGVLLVSVTTISPLVSFPVAPPRLPSAPAIHHETRYGAQRVGFLQKQIKMPDGLVGKNARLFARPFGAEQGNECRLAGRMILASRFADRDSIPFGVDQVVGDLEGETEIVA